MKEWTYLELTLWAEHYDVASGILWDLGTKGIEEKHPKGKWIRLRAFFDPVQDTEAVKLRFESACRSAGILLKALSLRHQREKDWLKVGRGELKPFPVGNRFYIIPDPELSGEMPPKRFPLWLEPGMAFGTGTHESTQLCLEFLEQLNLKGKKLLDIGTGSGILAIAAVKMGCRKVVACDIDLEAIHIARANGVVNQCDKEIEWVPGSVMNIKTTSFDVIVANLTAEVILTEIDAIYRQLGLGGTLILSGILDSQLSRIRAALKLNGIKFYHIRTRRKREWACLIAQKDQGKWTA